MWDEFIPGWVIVTWLVLVVVGLGVSTHMEIRRAIAEAGYRTTQAERDDASAPNIKCDHFVDLPDDATICTYVDGSPVKATMDDFRWWLRVKADMSAYEAWRQQHQRK
jgi:hypothetical protein